MSYFIPGKIVHTFTTKAGKQAVIRYPQWEDLEAMRSFINAVSQEDIFVTFSGETISKEGEMYYLAELFKGMEAGNTVYLAYFIDNQFAGSCSVIRDMQGRQRSYHVGIFGITIAKEFRGEGIGEILAKTIIAEAQDKIDGLQLLRLQVYSENSVARNLYEKLGFVTYGVLPAGVWYRGLYIDEVIMYKRLK